MKLKVYGWSGRRSEAPGPHHQTREICATTSQKEAARLAGEKGPHALFCLGETGNKIEVEIAMGKPHTVFWAPLDGSLRSKDCYQEAT